MRNDAQALSSMNHPRQPPTTLDKATPNGGAGANASWFYRRFRFRFDSGELLFLSCMTPVSAAPCMWMARA
jgi:hypothetical protein